MRSSYPLVNNDGFSLITVKRLCMLYFIMNHFKITKSELGFEDSIHIIFTIYLQSK